MAITKCEAKFRGVGLLLNNARADAAFARICPRGLPGFPSVFGHSRPTDLLCRFIPPEPEPPRLNTLYWPTGANRCAYFYALVDTDILTAISNVTDNDILSLGDDTDNDHFVTATMYPLAPMPLTFVIDKNPWYILPLVDKRYFWRSGVSGDWPEAKASGNYPAFTNWSDLTGFLDNETGTLVFATGDLAGDWLAADTATIGYDPINGERTRTVADCVDAVAWNLLRQTVRPFEGLTTLLETPDEAAVKHLAAIDKFWKGDGIERRSGWGWGEAGQGAPTGSGDNGIFAFNGSAQSLRINATSCQTDSRHATFGTYKGAAVPIPNGDAINGQKIVANDTIQARTTDGAAYPDQAILDGLTTRAAEQIRLWNRYFFDVTLNGICNWEPSGYTDLIEIAYRLDDAYTRVRSRPTDWLRGWNGVWNHQLVDALRPLPDYFDATATAAIVSGASGPATVGGSRPFTLFSPFGDVVNGDFVGVIWNRLEGRYEAIVKRC